MMEERETYYELCKDGELVMEGTYEECKEESLHCLDDDCAEIYKVVVYKNYLTNLVDDVQYESIRQKATGES